MARRSSKPEKPKLPDRYRQLIEEKDYSLQVEITITGFCGSFKTRSIGHPVAGKIQIELPDPDPWGEYLPPIDIGLIKGWRTIAYDEDAIIDWADSIDQEVYNAFDWLFYKENEADQSCALANSALYLESVVIDPMWRGHGLTLLAVATYIDVLRCDFVFLYPGPLNKNELSKREQARMRRRLKLYWQKLGFKNYDRKHGYMWTEGWACPEWLKRSDWF